MEKSGIQKILKEACFFIPFLADPILFFINKYKIKKILCHKDFISPEFLRQTHTGQVNVAYTRDKFGSLTNSPSMNSCGWR